MSGEFTLVVDHQAVGAFEKTAGSLNAVFRPWLILFDGSEKGDINANGVGAIFFANVIGVDDIPPGLRGLGITFIIVGLPSL